MYSVPGTQYTGNRSTAVRVRLMINNNRTVAQLYQTFALYRVSRYNCNYETITIKLSTVCFLPVSVVADGLR